MRSRTVPKPLGRLRLTERDVALLRLTFEHRTLTRDHFLALKVFGSIARATNRLRALFDHRYLRRAFISAGACSTASVYMIGPASIDVLSIELGVDRDEVARIARIEVGRMFLEHSLLAVEVRLFMEASATVSLYLAEPYCRHEYTMSIGGVVQRRVLKPDGYLEIEFGSNTSSLFVEVDRGHVSAKQMACSFAHYASYLRDGLFADVYQRATFSVLVVTTAGSRRIANLKRVAEASSTVRVCFTTIERLREYGALASIWEVPGHSGMVALVEPEATR